MSRQEIMHKIGFSDEKHFRENYLQRAVKAGLIELTIPEKPTSRLQKYRLSKLGRAFIANEQKLYLPEQKTSSEVTPEVTPGVTPEVASILQILDGEMSRQEIMHKIGLSDEKHFRENYLQRAVKAGLIELTIPEKPTSPLQKYRQTQLGRARIERKQRS